MNWVTGILVAGLGALMVDWIGKEAQSWTPKLVLRFLRTAVQRLPEGRRTRFGEEWHASLLELPTPISQILFTIGTLIAAERIRARERTEAKPTAPGLSSGIGGGVGTAVIAGAAGTISIRVRGTLWFMCCVSVVLGFYLLSVQVTSMRAQLKATEATISRAKLEISVLEARIAARKAAARSAARSMPR